jgi:serine/threonine protein kinase
MNNIDIQSMLRVGTILHGTYRIERYLSSGGFGNTYEVTHLLLGERLAVKEFFLKGVSQRNGDCITVSVSNNLNQSLFDSQKEKFKKEAIRLRGMDNSHVVKVHDLFEENGTCYFVMDFIDGESLAEKIKRLNKPLTEDEVSQYLSQILDALSCVHKKGLWHLDIKPSNIMVTNSGELKLIDFGASKQMKIGGGATTGTAMSYTPGYAPREQIEQSFDKFGPWTDFYALGATLYDLLTMNKPPMASDIDDENEIAFSFSITISANMRDLIFWLMKPKRQERPQSVDEIRNFIHDNFSSTILQQMKTIDTKDGSDNCESADSDVTMVSAGPQETTVSIDSEPKEDLDAEEVISAESLKEETSIGGWLMFFLVTLVAGMLYSCYDIFNTMKPLSGLSGGGVEFLKFSTIFDVFCEVCFRAFIIYSFIERKSYTVFITKAYLLLIVASNLLIMMVSNQEDANYVTILRNVVYGIIWFFYMCYSAQVENVIPSEYRKKTRISYFAILMMGFAILLFFFSLVGFNPTGTLDTNHKSLLEDSTNSGFEQTDTNNTVNTYDINESELKTGEYTDGRIAFTPPQDCKVEEVPDTTTGEKAYQLSTPSMITTVYSCTGNPVTDAEFNKSFNAWRDKDLLKYQEKILSTKKNNDKGHIIINRVARYRNKRYEYMRYFTVIYDNETGKIALVQTYGFAKSAHNKVVSSIRFE